LADFRRSGAPEAGPVGEEYLGWRKAKLISYLIDRIYAEHQRRTPTGLGAIAGDPPAMTYRLSILDKALIPEG
jgi:hypothetical protein